MHLAFAVGIIPLILAAISHFVPVLTRTDHPPRLILHLPRLAQGGGLLAIFSMQGWLPRWSLHLAAMFDLVCVVLLLGWVVRRSKACLGSPHPGWRWYVAALTAALLALACVPLMVSRPEWYVPLRNLHLHLNTLGLVGLAALGTLPLLLPTALGRPDPEAAPWLRRRLWPALAGVLAVAGGAAFGWPVAVFGAAVLLVLAGSLLGQWVRRNGAAVLWQDGVAASLTAALLGFVGLLLAGVGHGAGWLAPHPSVAAWFAGFLLPLVTGALSQLLPVWRWPGPVTPARGVMRSKLAATGFWRGLLFLASAGALLAGLITLGELLLAAGMLLFANALIQAVRVPPSAR